MSNMPSLQSKMGADLEDMVTCAICTFRLREPKHLQCQHAFCAHCLVDWMASPSNLHEVLLPCPSCRHLTPLPKGGVPALPTDFNKNALLEMLSAVESCAVQPAAQQCSICRLQGAAEPAVSFCSECEEQLCGRCLGDHNSEPALQDHSVLHGLPDDGLPGPGYVCHLHSGKRLGFYCPLCLSLICSICLRTGHRGHGAQTLEEAVRDKRESLRDTVSLIEQAERRVGQRCASEERRRLDAMVEGLKHEIHEHALSAKASVDEWEDQARTDLGKRKAILHTKIDQREEYLTRLTSLRAYYEERLSDVDPRRLLTDFDELLGRAEPLLRQNEAAFSLPTWTFVPLVWPARLGYLEKEPAGGSGHAPSDPVGGAKVKRADIPPEGAQDRAPGNDHGAKDWTNHTDNDDQESCSGEMDLLFRESSVTMSSNLYGNAIVNGKVKLRPLQTWTGPSGDGAVDGALVTGASDVILGAEQWLLVAEARGGHVQRLWFDGRDRAPETVLRGVCPRRLAMADDGSVAVTDWGYVHMLAVKGDAISARPKWTPMEMVQPWAVGFEERSHGVVLTDQHDCTVVVYDENLRHKHSFGGPDVFKSPNYVWCDQKGRILVSDQSRGSVHAYTISGELLWTVDHFAPDHPLGAPSGITGDAVGHVFVSSQDGTLGVFSADGRFICYLVNQQGPMTDVCGVTSRTDADRTLIAVCEHISTEMSTVRLWTLPRVGLNMGLRPIVSSHKSTK